jgi:hypothetical protein
MLAPPANVVGVVPRCIGLRLIGKGILGQAGSDLGVVHRGLVGHWIDAQVDFMHGSFLGGRGTTVDTFVDAVHGVWFLPPGAGIGDRDASRTIGIHGHRLWLLTMQALVERFPDPLAGRGSFILVKAVRAIRRDVASVQGIGSRRPYQGFSGVVLDRVCEVSSLRLLLIVLLGHDNRLLQQCADRIGP